MKNKKWIFIGLGLVAVIGLIVWFYNRKDTDVTASGIAAPKLSAVDAEIEAKITQNIENVKANTEWYNNIKKQSLSQGLTIAQGLARAAIWGLKVDGVIPMNTHGAGEDGHKEYVKANY